jgi:transposase InsO family protein
MAPPQSPSDCRSEFEHPAANAHDLALRTSGLDQAKPADRPRLLSDNGSSYIAGDLARWLDDRKIKHLRGARYHPMTQGKIERWHQTLKNRILLENYFLPGDLEQAGGYIAAIDKRHPS